MVETIHVILYGSLRKYQPEFPDPSNPMIPLAQKTPLADIIRCKDYSGLDDAKNAIAMVDEKARIDGEACIGCGECILICPNKAINVQWNQSIPIFLENMVEYTMGALANKAGKALFINFITDVSPACDCYPTNDAPIVKNIGVVAAADPVAIDQASVDLVNAEPVLAGSRLKTNTAPGEDKFKGIYPKVDWEIQLEYAQQLGLGSRSYELIRL